MLIVATVLGIPAILLFGCAVVAHLRGRNETIVLKWGSFASTCMTLTLAASAMVPGWESASKVLYAGAISAGVFTLGVLTMTAISMRVE